jgi:hypothetical protein
MRAPPSAPLDSRNRLFHLSTTSRRAPYTERKSYLYVNNRLEGCAPLTIEAVVGVATHTY